MEKQSLSNAEIPSQRIGQAVRNVDEPIELSPHPFYMQKAFEQAMIAESLDEVPIGAVIIHQGRMIAAAHNQREMLRDPTAHAEMLAIREAARATGDVRLVGSTVYTTVEPCFMCAGALCHARSGHPRLSQAGRTHKTGEFKCLNCTVL